HSVVGGELRDHLRWSGIRRYADDQQLIFVLRLQFDEIGNLVAARRAPGRPEIHENDFSVEIPAVEGLSIKRLQREAGDGDRILDEGELGPSTTGGGRGRC